MRYSITNIQYLIFTTFIALFFPQFLSSTGLLLEWILTGLLLLLSICFFVSYRNKIKISTGSLIISTLFLFLLFISVARSFDIFIFNDLFELIKPVYFFSFFLVGYNINWTIKKVEYFFNCLMSFLCFASVFGIFESLTDIGNTIAHTVYKDLRGGVQYKAVFSFISPYTFASVLILPLFYYLFKLIQLKKGKIKNSIFLSLFFVCFVLTQSRTTFICLIFVFIFLFVNMFVSNWIPFRKIFIRLFIFIIAFVALSIPFLIPFAEKNLSYLYIGLDVVIRNISDFDFQTFIYSSPSISNRYEQLMFAIEKQGVFPFLGCGIGKALFMPESFYAMYYYRVGLLGVLIHFAFLVYAIYCAYYIGKKYTLINKDSNMNFILILCSIAVYFASFFITYFSSAVNDQTRSGFIFYVLIGMLCHCKKRFKQNNCI
jgi:hypothetical protein